MALPGRCPGMSDTGRQLRLGRLGREGRHVIVPMDHGITDGPVTGLVDVAATVEAVARNGADAVVTHRGIVRRTRDAPAGLGRIVHLNGATALGPEPNDKRLVCSVETAVATGADAVSFHLNVGSRFEGDQLASLGTVVTDAHRLGVPVLAMAYPRGPAAAGDDPDHVATAVRAAAEVDADLIKTSYPGEGLERATAAADVPVLIAGGEPAGDRATLAAVAAAMDAGAAGVSMGRSIFQHDDPGAMTAAVAAVVHGGASADEALEHLGD